ncbi:MAG: energy transducer TonB [Pseudomonadota bacterium]
MKTDSRALELYAAGQPDTDAMAGLRPTALSPAWFASAVFTTGPVRALFYSLLLHGLLLLICLAVWRLLPTEQARPSVISVFTLQQEGEPAAMDAARSGNAPAVKHRKEPIAKEIHDNKEVGSGITSSPSSSPLARPEAGLGMTPEPPMPAAAQQGAGSGSTAPHTNPVAGTGEGAATGEVLARPLYQANPPPPYPRLARKLGQEGLVQLEVLVSVTGIVDDLRIAVGSGHESLDAAALEAVRSWRFSAGRRNGQPVAMRVRVPVRFSLRSGS